MFGRVMISGTSSGSGKTTASAAILALAEKAQAYKGGPDFLDPMFHTYVTGNDGINLDAFMFDETVLKGLYLKHESKSGLNIIEGMMGLYDGMGFNEDNYSSAHIARILKCPVILVVDGRNISGSIAAIVQGYMQYDPSINIQGVIINRTNAMMYEHLKEAIESRLDVICVGYLENDPDIVIPERHLGIMQANEVEDLDNRIAKLKESAARTLDMELIEKIAYLAPKLNNDSIFTNYLEETKDCFKGLKVAVAKDKAFSFYYSDNLALMEHAGMELIYFSPLKDQILPEADCLYLGGGYPEVFAQDLVENVSMRNSILDFSRRGKFVYAECGGLLYLNDKLIAKNGIEYQMCGVFPHTGIMKNKLNHRFGYINCKDRDGYEVRGHEFHYSEIQEATDKNNKYFDVAGSRGEWQCGYISDNTIAGYPHIHFFSNVEYFKNLFKKAYI